jgi:fused signal recognition particle receptor
VPSIFLVLIAVVVIFGVAAVVVGRQRAKAVGAAPVATPIAPTPARSAGPIAAAEVEAEADVAAEVDGEPESFERPRFRDRMAKSRAALVGVFSGVRGRAGITNETWDELEEALLRADVGVRVTDELLNGLRARVKAKELTDPDALLDALQADMIGRLSASDRALRLEPGDADSPNVWLFVGVNGVGKTTTIGKVGAQQRQLGRTVLMAAGDTFRAAAAEQLATWAQRSGSELVRGNEGSDPSAVIFDGIESASARKIELVLADTAGRLHNKTNLMEELRKVRRVAGKGRGRVTEVLLVIDATTGQNGLAQARQFAEATEVTAASTTSARNTMPAPPPNGMSSTVRCRSVAKSRISVTSSAQRSASNARPASERKQSKAA